MRICSTASPPESALESCPVYSDGKRETRPSMSTLGLMGTMLTMAVRQRRSPDHGTENHNRGCEKSHSFTSTYRKMAVTSRQTAQENHVHVIHPSANSNYARTKVTARERVRKFLRAFATSSTNKINSEARTRSTVHSHLRCRRIQHK